MQLCGEAVKPNICDGGWWAWICTYPEDGMHFQSEGWQARDPGKLMVQFWLKAVC